MSGDPNWALMARPRTPDHRVHDRLGVHHDGDAVGRSPEQPVGLDDLRTPLVDECRGVDRNLCAHVPLGVSEGLLDGYVCRRLPSRGMSRNAPPLQVMMSRRTGLRSEQALEDGRVFRVDRDHRGPSFAGQGHDAGPADDQRLLVGQGEFLAGLDGRDGGSQPGVSDQGVDHDVRNPRPRRPAPRPPRRHRPSSVSSSASQRTGSVVCRVSRNAIAAGKTCCKYNLLRNVGCSPTPRQHFLKNCCTENFFSPAARIFEPTSKSV